MRSLVFLLLLVALNVNAQNGVQLNVAAPAKNPDITITDLEWMDKNKMEQEIASVTELTQSKLGISLRKDLSDLQTLQRIVDSKLVEEDDYDTQQAMGVVIGNVLLADFPHTLEWKVFKDKLGRSRAICAKNTQQCIFPVTMLSRRMELGIQPNVRKLYDDAVNSMSAYLPQMPYGGGILYRLPR